MVSKLAVRKRPSSPPDPAPAATAATTAATAAAAAHPVPPSPTPSSGLTAADKPLALPSWDAPDTRPLDGIRALLNIWILVFHALYMMSSFLPKEAAEALFEHWWFVKHGYLAVDGFFVLTGYLLAGQLMRAADKGVAKKTDEGGGTHLHRPSLTASTFDLRSYFFTRWQRIMIPYLVLAAAHCWWLNARGSYHIGLIRMQATQAMMQRFFPGAAMVDNGCGTLFMNWLHLPMFAPYNGCFIHSWSVAVQYHAYLWLPVAWLWLNLDSGKRMAVFVVIVEVVTTVARGVGQYHQGAFAEGTVAAGALELFWYSNTLLRLHTIVYGMLAAWLVRRTNLVAWLRRKTVAASLVHVVLGVVGPAAYMAVILHGVSYIGDYRYARSPTLTAYVVLFAVGGVVSGLLWCYMVIAAVHRLGVWGASPAIPAIMSSAPLSKLAEWSYWAYLVHPAVFNALFSHPWLLYPPSTTDGAPMSLLQGAAIPYSDDVYIPTGRTAPLIWWWARMRSWLAPEGASLPPHAMVAYTLIAITATYLVGAIATVTVEAVLRRLMDMASVVTKPAVWVYSLVVMGLGVVVHVAGTAGALWWITPDIEATIAAMSQQKAQAAGAPAVNATGGMPVML